MTETYPIYLEWREPVARAVLLCPYTRLHSGSRRQWSFGGRSAPLERWLAVGWHVVPPEEALKW